MEKLSSDLNKMVELGIPTHIITRLISVGWKFWLSTWTDRHKNDDYHELNFQSPNMKKPASIASTYFEEIDRAYLFEREAFAVSIDWADALFNHKLAIQNPISEALRKHFDKTKDCRFESIYASEIDFQVVVAPKNQTKPKKVKVKITIQ
jgi:hypothetical protein